MKFFVFLLYIFFQFPSLAFSDASISPILFFLRHCRSGSLTKHAYIADERKSSVTVRFANPPDYTTIIELEKHGLEFTKDNDTILHTKHIYLATVNLDSLDSLAQYNEIIRIESTFNPSLSSTLDVSNPLVQASQVWDLSYNSTLIDGSGIIVANVDTGIDVYHPAFFKADGGIYNWIDVNESGQFENGADAVDLNRNGLPDTGEILRFFDASFYDVYNFDIMKNPENIYDADMDWLYNDQNGNGIRDYGPDKGFTENSPSFGELLFIISDDNGNNDLDIDEQLTALGTSKIIAIYDRSGKHYRGVDLLTSTGDTVNHGTPSSGIVGGQIPGRRFTGMAPGLEFISINRYEIDKEYILKGVLWAKDLGADIIMYEFGSWIMEFLDGSSNIEVFINDLHEEGIHQFTASGNLAGPKRKKHVFFTLEPGDVDTLNILVPKSPSISEVYFSLLWRNRPAYLPSTNLKLSDTDSVILSGDNKPYTAGMYTVISGIDYSTKGTSRLDAIISSENDFHGEMSLIFKNNRRVTLDIHGYISDNKTSWMNGTQFQNHLTDDGTVCSPGTSEKGITVGAFDPRGYKSKIGDLCDFSSWGDTIDGRRAVDITAPGYTIFSPASHYSTGDQPGGYVNFVGTSAALPHVTGCAALIIQASGGISPDNLSQTLLQYALADESTGPVPNNKWGYGKLQVYDSIALSYNNTVHQEPFSVSQPYPNPFNKNTNFEINIPSKIKSTVYLYIYNILGQKIRTIPIQGQSGNFLITWNARDDNGMPVSSGIYIFQFFHENLSITRKALYLK